MNFFLEVVVIALLLVVFFQDMQSRTIHIVLPIAIAVVGAILFFNKAYPFKIIFHTIIFLLLTCLGLYFYLVLRAKKNVNPLKSVGAGDFLFFFAVIPYFSTANYILYFITGMLFSIFSFLILKTIVKTDLVPLAGFLALYMVLLKCIFYLANLDFFEAKLI